MTATNEPRTAAAIQARRRASQDKLDRVHAALIQMSRKKTPITYRAVAQRARVSRTFLYENPNARTLMAEALTRATDSHKQAQAAYDDQQEASWQQRALNSEDALKAALEVLTQCPVEASPADDGAGESHEGFVDVVADLPADA